VGLEWGPLSLVSAIEELLGRNSSCSGLENREYGLKCAVERFVALKEVALVSVPPHKFVCPPCFF
jgi:hypothetical protein